MQREKRTYSGPLLEVDFYPIFSDGRRIPTRAPKSKRSTEEQKKYNRTVATKKLIRLVNTNFDSTDYFMHPTYQPEMAPQDEKAARRDITNYLRRVKRMRVSETKRMRKNLKSAEEALECLPDNPYLQESVESIKKMIRKLSQPFKYVYAIEMMVYKTGIYAGCINWHFHLFLTGGIDNRILESMWSNGLRTNRNNYQPEKFGPEAAARYMSKDPQGWKSFSYSRNLTQPVEKTRDGKVSKSVVEKMAMQRVDDREYWENKYKGYRFIRCYNRYNEYNGHWYVSAIMYKTGGAPPRWEEREWITET